MWNPGAAPGFYGQQGVYTDVAPFTGSGIGVSVGASLGTVSGNVEGYMVSSYNRHLSAPGSTYMEFQFNGIPDESNIRTNLGANLTVGGQVNVDFPWWTFIPDVNAHYNLIQTNPELRTNTDFLYANGATMHGSTSYMLGSLGADVVVAGVNADLRIMQDVYFTPGAIRGQLSYTNLMSGITRTTSMGAANGIWTGQEILLDSPGVWAFTLEDLELVSNSFYTDIGANINANLWATILGTMSIGGGLDFYRNNPFALDFLEVAELGDFEILVDKPEPDPVPIPGAVWLLGSGLAGLAALRRRSKG